MDSHTDRFPQSHLIIFGHPSTESFNAALAQAYEETVRSRHHSTTRRDLYALNFDPLLSESERTASDLTRVRDDARHELELATQADVIVFVYPLWFGAPPAIVKGYLPPSSRFCAKSAQMRIYTLTKIR